MGSKPYDPSDSLSSLDISEPDSPDSSSSLVFRDGEWQLPLAEDYMNYQSFKPKEPPASCLHHIIFPN